MRAERMVLTNNDLAACPGRGTAVEYREGDARAVLVRARDLIHTGWRLVSHPRAGGLPGPGNPYRSIVLEPSRGPAEHRSVAIIEEAIARLESEPGRTWSERARADLKAMDWWLAPLREAAE